MAEEFDSNIEAELELLTDELLRLQEEKMLNEEDIDVIKTLIASIAIKRLKIDSDIIISHLFRGGRPIVWH